MLDNKVLSMTPGEALLDVPVGDFIQRLGVGIAEAQLRLDQMAVRIARGAVSIRGGYAFGHGAGIARPQKDRQAARLRKAVFWCGVGLHIQRRNAVATIRKHVQSTFAQGMCQRGVGNDENAGAHGVIVCLALWRPATVPRQTNR